MTFLSGALDVGNDESNSIVLADVDATIDTMLKQKLTSANT